MFKPFRLLTRRAAAAATAGFKPPPVSGVRRSSSVLVRTVCRQRRPVLLAIDKFDRVNERYKRTKNQDDDDSDDDLDLELDDSSQLIKFRTSTMRMDNIIKHALGKSRNKIEVAFYESRIRVNGEKVAKKSYSVEVGDEIDLVKGPSPNNPDFLVVSRVEVLSSKLDGDELQVKLRRFKNLLIDNYDNKWKSST